MFDKKYIRKDAVKRSCVKCVHPVYGTHLMTYRFNNIQDHFSSPFISWENLSYCNGSYGGSYLRSSVKDGKKLYAGDAIAIKRQPDDSYPFQEEALDQIEAIAKAQPDDVIVGLELPATRGFLNFFICRKGNLIEHYNIEDVFEFYYKLGFRFPPEIREEVLRLCRYPIAAYACTSTAPFNYAKPVDGEPRTVEGVTARYITTGLLLGYPLESTAHLIEQVSLFCRGRRT